MTIISHNAFKNNYFSPNCLAIKFYLRLRTIRRNILHRTSNCHIETTFNVKTNKKPTAKVLLKDIAIKNPHAKVGVFRNYWKHKSITQNQLN